MSFAPDSDINNSEMLFRVVRPFDMFWKEKHKKLSSAAFKDKKGLSVDRDGERSNQEVGDSFVQRNFDGALVSRNAGECREIGTYLVPKHDENIYHALILDSADVYAISSKKCKKLAEIFEVVFEDISTE